jgi:hypothetical protein
MTNGTALAEVGPSTTAIRLGYIREFLMWRINAEILRATPKERPNLAALRDLTEQEIRTKHRRQRDEAPCIFAWA